MEELASLSGLDPEYNESEVERLAVEHMDCVADDLTSGCGPPNSSACLIQLLGEDRYRSTYRQYINGDYLEKVAGGLGDALQLSLDTVNEAHSVPDDIAGVNVLPAMTIHKSKGLECNRDLPRSGG